MSKGRKANIKRKRAAAVLVSSALAVAPLLVQAPYAGATVVTEPPPSEAPPMGEPFFQGDVLGDRIVSLEGPQTIVDLRSIFYTVGTNPMYLDFSIESSDESVAYNERGYEEGGLLKIHPVAAGTATFTVTVYQYESEYAELEFNVTVVDGSGAERKLDISDIVKKMMSYTGAENPFTDKDNVSELLAGIKPTSLPYDVPRNHVPEFNEQTPISDVEVAVGQTVTLGDLRSHFSDADNDILFYTYTPVEGPEGEFEYNGTNLYDESYGSGSDWKVYGGYYPGTSYYRIIAFDGRGGIVDSNTIAITTTETTEGVNQPPTLNTSNPVSSFFSSGYDKTMYLSDGAVLNLNDMFQDPDSEALTYEVEVNEHVLVSNSPDYVYSDENRTYTLPGRTLSLHSFGDLGITYNDINHINKIIAHDEVSGKSVTLNTNIQRGDYNPFPETTSMYVSTSDLTSSYLLNIGSEVGFGNGSYTYVLPEDIHPVGQGSVTASVYQNEYETQFLKFKAGTEVQPNTSKIKIYAHDRENLNVLYQDDFNYSVVSPEMTTIPGLNIPGIDLKNLFPNDWWDPNFGNYISVLSEESNITWELFSGRYLKLTSSVPTDTKVTFKIDPRDGTQVYYVPYKQPEGVYNNGTD
ncbi:hypothetical protein [Paenibacillus ferrarius]|uniref:hypothetical protein n=1 Tax=Paenibacillus ferrarius TaxID=1469647 RepID=UPI003D277A38